MADRDKYAAKQLENTSKRIKGIRKGQEYKSAEKFAFHIDFNRVQYLRYEANESDMRLSTFFRLIYSMNMSPVEFFQHFIFEEEDPSTG